ncbi:MAG: glycosyltransferase [Opitutia bacterium]
MRLFHTHFGRDGGAERFFVSLVNALAEAGVEQTLLIRPGRSWRGQLPASAEVHEGLPRLLTPSRFLLPWKFGRLLRAQRPVGVLAWMPRAADFMPDWKGGLRAARLGDYPTSLKHFRNVDVLVCNTPGIAEHVKGLGWKRPVRVISNFPLVKPAPPAPREALGAPAGRFTVLGVGRFVRRKGFHTLIAALRDVPEAHVCLLGEGEEEGNLRRQAAELGVADRVRFAGWQPDPAPWLAACDVFVMPSVHEPLGNVILEAWGAGAPVVSSRSEGPSWMMRDGEDGLLFGLEDAAGRAAALRRLRDDPALRARLVEGGRRTLDASFSRAAVTRAYVDLFTRPLTD